MSNLTNKFKVREPKETVKILQDFFTGRGLNYKITVSKPTEAGTWFCHIELLYHDRVILTSNGKGMTEDFSLASGFAELYERFSNKINCTFSPVIMGKYIELSESELGFKLAPGEKLLTFEEQYNKPLVKKFYDNYLGNTTQISQYFDVITNGQLIGVPCQNFLDEDDIEYYDPRILTHVMGSTGMCAGNSVEEALNQGLSEICELFSSHKFFTQRYDTYYQIDETTITNPELLNCLSKIREKGLKIKLLDLSYNTGMPVLASVLVNPKLCNVHVNCGSFPVFDITLERIITELYQGVQTYDEISMPQTPWRSEDANNYMINYLNSKTQATYMPEEVFNNFKVVPYNSEVFLTDKDITNEELNNYYKQLFTKLGLHVYYIDVGVIPEVAALQCFYDTYDCQTEKYNVFKYTAKEIKESWFDDTIRLYAFSVLSLQEQYHKAYEMFQLFISNCLNKPPHNSFSGNLMGTDWNNPYPTLLGGQFEIFKITDFFVNLNDSNYQAAGIQEINPISNRLRYYQMLKRYLDCNEYSKEEIKTIFNSMGIECKDEDFNVLRDPEKLFIEIFCQNFHDMYFDDEYTQLIKCYLPYYKKGMLE